MNEWKWEEREKKKERKKWINLKDERDFLAWKLFECRERERDRKLYSTYKFYKHKKKKIFKWSLFYLFAFDEWEYK